METLLYRVKDTPRPMATPGNVASIGTTATQFQLKQTGVYSKPRYHLGSVGKMAKSRGSDSAKGTQRSQFSGVRAGSVYFKPSRDSGLRNKGVRITSNYVSQERVELPVLNLIPHYSWRLKLNAATSNYGSLFKDLPYGYGPAPGDVLRGTSYPRKTIIEGVEHPETVGEKVFEQKRGKNSQPIPLNYTARYERK